MGAGGRRRGGGLTLRDVEAANARPRVARLLVPASALATAALLALVLYSTEQVLAGAEGAWIELGAGAVAGLCLLLAGSLAIAGLRRYRDGLTRRAILWSIGTLAALTAGAVALIVIVLAAQVRSALSGADVHATAPLLQGLPRPPTAKLVDERAGPAGTESISDDLEVPDLNTVPAFYRNALPKAGWIEDSAPTVTDLLRFHRGEFEVTVLVSLSGGAVPHGPGDYAVTVDRGTTTPSTSPS
jgi:hypothetical protein